MKISVFNFLMLIHPLTHSKVMETIELGIELNIDKIYHEIFLYS